MTEQDASELLGKLRMTAHDLQPEIIASTAKQQFDEWRIHAESEVIPALGEDIYGELFVDVSARLEYEDEDTIVKATQSLLEVDMAALRKKQGEFESSIKSKAEGEEVQS